MPKKESTGAIAERYSVRCRYCGQKNSVKEDYKNGQANCGKCKLPLSNAPHKKFADLSKHEYVHPADSKALAALKAIPGIDTALRKFLSVTLESAMRINFMASSVKITPQQYPDLHAKLQVACTTLGVEMPDFFLQQNPVVNAFTFGSERHVIVLFSGLIERLTDEEILAVIAHEVGHIHAEHVLYLTAARIFELLLKAGTAAIPGGEIAKFILNTTISSALMAWARRAELSCDRAGLLVVQDPHVVGRVMMKLAGGTFASKMDYEQFIEQGREFQKHCDENQLDNFWANVINAGQTHPFPIWRVAEIIKWAEEGEYNALMQK
ncbi:MAG TPA: M48 family metallopeptidase [Pyrinomonadaceae bacterium]|nr:M48 family metallopeptidase [Pyrinomonadaceae bacterium]